MLKRLFGKTSWKDLGPQMDFGEFQVESDGGFSASGMAFGRTATLKNTSINGLLFNRMPGDVLTVSEQGGVRSITLKYENGTWFLKQT